MSNGVCGSCRSPIAYGSTLCQVCGNQLNNPNYMQMQQPNQQMQTIVGPGDKKDVGVAYLLHIFPAFFAFLGLHRIYCGYTASGIIMLIGWWISIALTFILIGIIPLFIITIWWIVDLFLIPGMCEPKQQISHVMQYQIPPPPQY